MLSIPAFQGFSVPTLLSAGAILFIGIYVLFFSNRYRFSSNSPPLVKGSLPLFGSLRFFSARWDFFQDARDQAPTGNFSFFLGKHPVVGLSGTKGRQLFFESRDLGFTEGYAVLFGQSPNSLNEEGISASEKDYNGPGGYFTKRIVRMLKPDMFKKALPKLMGDVQLSMEKLKNDPTGMTDPWESLYRMVFQLTIRIVGCDDIASDPELLEKTLQLYETIEASSTPTAIMFPKFPSLGIIKRTIAGGRLYMTLKKIIDHRKATGARGDDPLQFLIDEGDSLARIIEFILGALFAGLLNSGINVAWVLAYLGTNPEWMAKCRQEITQVAAKYAKDENAPLAEQLTHIPSDAWETEFPVIDVCLKDSIRIQTLGTAFRKNISGRAIPTGQGDEVIPPGAFVTYAIADVHLNPEIYTDPEKWDPSRYLPDRSEDKKSTHAYMGWGVGRHPCLGMRFAKFEQNIITAFFLANFDYELADKNGNTVHETPPVNNNGHSAHKPSERVYLRYKTR